MATAIKFTAHNIRLDDGSYTFPGGNLPMEDNFILHAAKRMLNVVFPGDKSHLRIADLGCLEGGYATEFARMGFQSVGLEVRDLNIEACHHVKEHTDLPNLSFVQDDAWNLADHGTFDAVFCCGLFYHLDNPRKFLELLSRVTSRMIILETHFSTEHTNRIHHLSDLCEHEGLQGRWFTEFNGEAEFATRDEARWASWDNYRSFWIRREHLLGAIHKAGFDTVLEQFDSVGPPGLDKNIADVLLNGYYKVHERGLFIGIKTEG